MRTRLSHLLVAGLVACATWPCALAGETSAETIAVLPGQEAAALQGASLNANAEGAPRVRLEIPGYKGTPRCQVLGKPLRVVLDLPGVVMSEAINRQQVRGLVSGVITKARIAQFAPAPSPVTRVVFEVGAGTQVDLAPDATGLTIAFAKGQGPTKISVGSPAVSQAAPVIAAVVTPAVVFAQPAPKPVVAKAAVPSVPLASLPSLGLPYQAFPQLALNSTLPTLGTIQATERAVERQETSGRSGRTLGEGAQRYTGSKITIDVKGAELSAFLRLIADHAKMNLIADPDVAGQTYEFKFTDTPWDLVLDTILKHAGLGKEVNNGIIRVAKVEKLQKEEEDRKKLQEAKALAGDLVSVTRPLSFAKAADAKAVVDKVLTKRGSLIVDERTNTLILTDLPKNLKLIDELLLQMDIPIQQVQIEARIVEASKDFSRQFGVRWPGSSDGAAVSTSSTNRVGGATTWNSAADVSVGNSTAFRTTTSITEPAGELWVSFIRNNFSLNVVLQAAEKNSLVKIVSNPKVVTQNNKKAKILSGRKIPYATQQSGNTSGAITTSFVDANLELSVTPQITNDGTILMDLKLTKSEADFGNVVQGTPTILNKELETQVLVKDGGTAILGGVYTSNVANGSSGVPYLSKIPVLGFLFRSKTTSESNAELLLFITPRILRN